MRARVNRRPSRLLAEQSGFTVIEVMVTAVLVVMIGVGVLGGLDSAALTSGANKSRSIAASLAEDDLERMRGMTVSDLSNLRETRTTTVQGVPFEIESRAQWVSDQSGNISCRAGLVRADYMAVSSTVTWPDMRNIAPVRSDTIIAPANGTFGPNQGSLAVEIKDRAGRGVPGLDVALAGPEAQSDATNVDGCVLWGYLESGAYTISFARQGWVDPQGVSNVTKDTDVPSMAVSTAAFDYDVAAEVRVNVETKVGPNPPQSANAEYVSVGHSSLAPPGTRVFGSGSSSSTYTLSSLFPFTSGYSVYSGNCAGANPLNYGQNALVTLGPGDSQSFAVREPALNVTVRDGGSPRSGARVTFTAIGSGCSGTMRPGTTDSAGQLPSSWDPGIPYGPYDVCATFNSRSRTLRGVQNSNPDGTSVVIDLPSSGGTPCP
jgi:Tfp pilus assembly protein PilV